jgi:hypothetical protein
MMLKHVKHHLDTRKGKGYSNGMKEPPESSKTGAWIIRNVPAELMRRTRMAGLAERKTVRQLIMDLVEARLQELERKGILPKGK